MKVHEAVLARASQMLPGSLGGAPDIRPSFYPACQGLQHLKACCSVEPAESESCRTCKSQSSVWSRNDYVSLAIPAALCEAHARARQVTVATFIATEKILLPVSQKGGAPGCIGPDFDAAFTGKAPACQQHEQYYKPEPVFARSS